MKRKKIMVAAFFTSVVLIFTACGTAAKQLRESEPKQVGNSHMQTIANQATTVAAVTTAAQPVATARSSQAITTTAQPASQTTAKPMTSGTVGGISLGKAKEIALSHAGVTAAQAKIMKEKSGQDDGVSKYKIEFTANGFAYEYEVHAGTGVILDAQRKRAAEESGRPAQPSQAGEIGMEKAKAIALADAGVQEAQARFTNEDIEHDDGIVKYEIEFVAGGLEYEYDIHAGTGVILRRDIDD